MVLGECLYAIADVRPITPRRCGFRFPSCVLSSSVIPSLRYSWPGSSLRFSNGSTTSIIFPACTGCGLRHTNFAIVIIAIAIQAAAATPRHAFQLCNPAGGGLTDGVCCALLSGPDV